jgi:hypothetical protein
MSPTVWPERLLDPLGWPKLGVTEFFTECNWQGLPIARPQPPAGHRPIAAASLEVPPLTANWPGLSVDQFFGEGNWSGLVRAIPTAPSEAQSGNLPIAADWQSQPVQAFFDNVNWSGQLRPIYDQAEAAPQLSMTMPVAEFFGLIAWDMKPAIAALPVTPAAPVAPSREITLSDLSDLF